VLRRVVDLPPCFFCSTPSPPVALRCLTTALCEEAAWEFLHLSPNLQEPLRKWEHVGRSDAMVVVVFEVACVRDERGCCEATRRKTQVRKKSRTRNKSRTFLWSYSVVFGNSGGTIQEDAWGYIIFEQIRNYPTGC